jgi:hypothetical protein
MTDRRQKPCLSRRDLGRRFVYLGGSLPTLAMETTFQRLGREKLFPLAQKSPQTPPGFCPRSESLPFKPFDIALLPVSGMREIIPAWDTSRWANETVWFRSISH